MEPKGTPDVTRLVKLWISLGVVYAALLAWHQPLWGPLTEAEIRKVFGEQFEQMSSGVNPQAQAFLNFFLTDDGRPFYMINLNALPDKTARTEKAARTYGLFMAPRLLSRASYPVLSTHMITRLNNSIGSSLDSIEHFVVVRYRSRRDFLEIISTPEFRAALGHKHESLDAWYSAPAYAGPIYSIPLYGLLVLMAAGGLGTIFIWPRRTPISPNTARDLHQF